MSQMNPKEAFHNNAYSVQLPYIAAVTLFEEGRGGTKNGKKNTNELTNLLNKLPYIRRSIVWTISW